MPCCQIPPIEEVYCGDEESSFYHEVIEEPQQQEYYLVEESDFGCEIYMDAGDDRTDVDTSSSETSSSSGDEEGHQVEDGEEAGFAADVETSDDENRLMDQRLKMRNHKKIPKCSPTCQCHDLTSCEESEESTIEDEEDDDDNSSSLELDAVQGLLSLAIGTDAAHVMVENWKMTTETAMNHSTESWYNSQDTSSTRSLDEV